MSEDARGAGGSSIPVKLPPGGVAFGEGAGYRVPLTGPAQQIARCPDCGGHCSYSFRDGPGGCVKCGRKFAWKDLEAWTRGNAPDPR